MSHKVTTVALIIFAIGLSGCASIAQGVTEALLKQDGEEQDTRAGEVKAHGEKIESVRNLARPHGSEATLARTGNHFGMLG